MPLTPDSYQSRTKNVLSIDFEGQSYQPKIVSFATCCADNGVVKLEPEGSCIKIEFQASDSRHSPSERTPRPFPGALCSNAWSRSRSRDL